MKLLRWLNLLVILILLAACGSNGNGGGLPSFFGGTPTPLPTAQVTILSAPDAQAAIRAYLDAFKTEDYNAMYSLLSRVSQDSISLEDFAKTNRDALNKMSAGSFDYEVLSSLLSPYAVQVAFRVTYHSALVGDIQRDIVARFALENDQWKLQWDPGLILPDLTGGNRLAMDYDIPSRGNIYDRNGQPIAAQSDAYAFDIIPGEVSLDTIETLLSEVWRLCGINPDDLRDQIANTPAQFAIPLCEASEDESERIRSISPAGLRWTPYNSRYYFKGGIASQVIGYTQPLDPTQMQEYLRKGYAGDERIGQSGIEGWGEDNGLAGKHGGSLYVINPSSGQIVTRIANSNPRPADSIYLTIDGNLQYYAQQAISQFNGSVVVLERNTGRVLAMASSPGFDPNLFEPNNPNSSLLSNLLQRTDQPLYNRATQGQYPLGSVFKIITMAAGMESGLYTQETTYDCQYDFTELGGGIVLHDWTWDHCQDRLQTGRECNSSDSQPSGNLTLPEGLMRSCNPYFWHIGLDLYRNDRAGDIAKMARGFGLGQLTAIGQVDENPGQILEATDAQDATNQAIGQGSVLVTPLQVARFVAAIGNGGTLYRPQLVEKIQPVDGESTAVFKPEAQGTLPITPDRLKIIQDAMVSVVENPLGTANFRLRGLQVPVAGKTGTAESGSGRPHAWFAGYTMNEQNSGLPDIAVAVIVENIGEGSDYAAPIFKAVIETYYLGRPYSRPWFGPIGEPLYTPTPLGGIPTKTPRP